MEAELHLVSGVLQTGRGEAVAVEKHFREALDYEATGRTDL